MPLKLRLVLGFMALWGTLYAFAALAGEYGFVVPPTLELPGEEAALGPFFRAASAANALVVLLAFAAIAFRSERLRAGQKVGWVFAMMFLYPLVVPPFWYLHIWRKPG